MEYLGHPEGSPARAALERKFGKGVIIKLVKEYQDEQSTNAWIESSTTACPNCKIHVEKSMGCNHVCELALAFKLHHNRSDSLGFHVDDVREVYAALLLPLRGKVGCRQSLCALLCQRRPVLWETI